MTRAEFVAGYAARSGIAEEFLLSRRVAVVCTCGDDICQGWAMIPRGDEVCPACGEQTVSFDWCVACRWLRS